MINYLFKEEKEKEDKFFEDINLDIKKLNYKNLKKVEIVIVSKHKAHNFVLGQMILITLMISFVYQIFEIYYLVNLK